MTPDNDFNTVKPVEGAQNVPPLAEPNNKKQQKQKQRWQRKSKRNEPQQLSQGTSDPMDLDGGNRHLIDYRA
jgi:hypothetical protein